MNDTEKELALVRAIWPILAGNTAQVAANALSAMLGMVIAQTFHRQGADISAAELVLLRAHSNARHALRTAWADLDAATPPRTQDTPDHA